MSDDPYLIPGTETLRNRPGLTAADELSRLEARMTIVRIAQLETDASLVTGTWDLRHLQRFHHHIFQDVFEWAGKLRTVDMAKDGNVFCRPQFIESAAADIFRDLAGKRHLRDLPRTEFVAAAGELLSAVNSLHPFREGNGRTQRAFLSRMAAQAGWRIDWTLLDPERNITASVAAFRGDDRPMVELLNDLVTVAN